MEYLLFINKFEIDKDRLKNKIKTLDNNVEIKDEDDNLIVNSKINPEELIKFHEIAKIIKVFTDWKDFSFTTLKVDCLNLVKKFNIKEYIIENKFHEKVPISAKSLYKHINPYLKHENINVNKNGDIIYIELKKFNNKLKYRLGCSNKNLWQKNNVVKADFSNFYIVLEEPRLAEEISDFLRLCWIFKLPLCILTKDQVKVEKIFDKAKKITKGIDYNKFTLKYIPHLSKDFIKVGFSKHSAQNEKDLLKFFKENEDEMICLIFGNDTYGLSQEIRDDLDYCFRLTPEIKKPLKASQALSYVLGFYTSLKV